MLSEIEFRKLFVINSNLVIIQPLFKQLMIANQMEFILFPFYVFNICRNLRFNGQLTLDCQFIYLALIKWCGYRWIKSLMCTIYIRHTHSLYKRTAFVSLRSFFYWFDFHFVLLNIWIICTHCSTTVAHCSICISPFPKHTLPHLSFTKSARFAIIRIENNSDGYTTPTQSTKRNTNVHSILDKRTKFAVYRRPMVESNPL